MSNEDLSEDMLSAVNALSRKLDYPAKDIEKGIVKIMKEKSLEEAKAYSTWKRSNRGLFKSKNYEFIVFGKTEMATVPVRSRVDPEVKENKDVSNINVIVKTDDGLKAYVMSFWEEDASLAEEYEVGKHYSGRLTLTTKGYANIIGKTNGVVKEPSIPQLEKLIPKIKGADISDAVSNIGKFGFYVGMVANVTDKGVEVDSPTALPVMCWTSSIEDVPNISEGDEVLVFGRSYENRSADVNLSASAIFKLAESVE